MNEAPESSPELLSEEAQDSRAALFSPLKKMRSNELKTLYRKSRNIGVLGGLALFFAIGLIVLKTFLTESNSEGDVEVNPFQNYLFFIMVGLCFFMTVAMWLRPAWGQTVGFLTCSAFLLFFILSLNLFALGLGIIGFCILPGSGVLFGRARVSHSIVKRNYLRRKKEGRYK